MSTFTPYTIRIRVPAAQQVSIVGDFNHWHSSAHPLVEVAPGLWERIIDLPPGKHRYAFFILDDAGGALHSRVLANGSVLWVPDSPDQAITLTPHPALALYHADPAPPKPTRRVA
ncbi:MAG TPA: glycogen-binding domain-containing protein [Phycisphaerae bacterium]|nr:glycogen-binding domain-containing protein [Phycisphaerae bacterium]